MANKTLYVAEAVLNPKLGEYKEQIYKKLFSRLKIKTTDHLYLKREGWYSRICTEDKADINANLGVIKRVVNDFRFSRYLENESNEKFINEISERTGVKDCDFFQFENK